ncbi:MAG: type I phosphomannose isomerase catalytic subunit [Bacillota bacterium]
MNLYPFLLDYDTKDYIWGGDDLSKKWNKQSPTTNIAESWELSDKSYIMNGSLKGELKRVLEKQPDLMGKRGMKYSSFPLLIKLINARSNLSIQVHPDDKYALINEGQFGKSEMWYICEAKDDAAIYLGFNRNTNRKEIESALESGKIEKYINSVKVKKGDCFFVPSGVVHAIRGGVTILEVQQNSNVTYRVYDYDRVDKKGNKRNLHIKQALEVMNFDKLIISQNDRQYQKHENYKKRDLISCDFFSTTEYIINSQLALCNKESFICFTVVEGEGAINDIAIQKGNTVFLPANCKGNINGQLTIITSEV